MTESLDFGERKPYKDRTDTFVIPVGDVLCYGVTNKEGESYAVTKLWWINEEHKPQIEELCEPWIANGFELYYGVTGGGSKDCPAVIEDEEQQRGINMPYCMSSREVGAYVGDTLIWLELVNPDKAYDYMLKHSNIPVAVQCDIVRYNSDERYRQVFDIANAYFQYYYVNRKPKDIKKSKLTEKDMLEAMYDA